MAILVHSTKYEHWDKVKYILHKRLMYFQPNVANHLPQFNRKNNNKEDKKKI